ncbi:HigA family addiction module antitoxin [Psychrobacter maritimus]|uniref:HigA family addiction module antitoxin n=1 Tax=Psychrobacter maritimus TaxID=256325 RepID=UPI002A0A5571|nr:HigA family addiction module antitoxin [Psychrobacter maritimus]
MIREKRSITADTALRLAKYFGGSAQFWLNLQSTYELRLVETDNLQFLDDIEPIKYA